MDSPYKFGRSTLKQFWCVKYKRISDAEAIAVDVEERMHNANPSQRDAVGRLSRTSHKAGMKPLNTLGVLVGKDVKTGKEVKTAGFSADMAKDIWNNWPRDKGKTFTYLFQKSGAKKNGKMRFTRFKCWRYDNA